MKIEYTKPSDFFGTANHIEYTEQIPEEITSALLGNELTLETFNELKGINDQRVYQKVVEILERKKRYEKNIVSIAKFAVKKSDQMKNKLSDLKKITQSGILLSTIWDIKKRDNYAGDNTFYGNAPTQVVEQAILRLTKPKAVILDAMAGSGTTIDVCRRLNRRCIAFDINPTRKDIKKNDSKQIPLTDNSVDFGFFHPPYWDMVKYSKNEGDLSTLSLTEFLSGIEQVLSEYKRVVRTGGYLSILIGDIVRNGKFVPLSRKIADIAEKLGFEDCGYAVKITNGSVSQRIRGKAIYAELAMTHNLKINHDVIMFWKK